MTTAFIDNKVYKNNNMELTIESYIKDRDNKECNYAMVNRLNDNTFIVVRNLQVNNEDGTCEWAHAIEYDIEEPEYAVSLLIAKATQK